MTDLFQDASFMGENNLNAKHANKKVIDSDCSLDPLVLVTFQISVWTGMSTEQTSVEVGAENMKRKRIVPASLLKPFSDFRHKARALCAERGEPYVNGYVMRKVDALTVERTLSVWRKEFCRQRDDWFAPQYEKSVSQRKSGVVPEGCSPDVVCPTTDFVLRRISFEFGAFELFGANGSHSSMQFFMEGLTNRFSEELDLIKCALARGPVTDALLCRMEALKERLWVWQGYRQQFGISAHSLDEGIAQAIRVKPFCRDKIKMLEFVNRAEKQLFDFSHSQPQEIDREFVAYRQKANTVLNLNAASSSLEKHRVSENTEYAEELGAKKQKTDSVNTAVSTIISDIFDEQELSKEKDQVSNLTGQNSKDEKGGSPYDSACDSAAASAGQSTSDSTRGSSGNSSGHSTDESKEESNSYIPTVLGLEGMLARNRSLFFL